MTPALLARAGEAAFGPRWQSELGRALGVTDRTVRNWSTGTTALPEGLGARLRAVLGDRAELIAAVRRELPRR